MLHETKLKSTDVDQIRQTVTQISARQAYIEIHQMTLNDPMLWAFAVCRGRRLGYEKEERGMA